MYFISWNIECDYRVLPFLNDRLKCVLMLQQFCGDLLHMVDNWIDNLIRYIWWFEFHNISRWIENFLQFSYNFTGIVRISDNRDNWQTAIIFYPECSSVINFCNRNSTRVICEVGMNPSILITVARSQPVGCKVGLQMSIRVKIISSKTVQQSRSHDRLYIVVIRSSGGFDHQLICDLCIVDILNPVPAVKNKFRGYRVIKKCILIVKPDCIWSVSLQNINHILNRRFWSCLHNVIAESFISGKRISFITAVKNPTVIRNDFAKRASEIHFPAEGIRIFCRLMLCLQKYIIFLLGLRKTVSTFHIYSIFLCRRILQCDDGFNCVTFMIILFYITDKVVPFHIIPAVCLQIVVAGQRCSVYGSVQTRLDRKFLRIVSYGLSTNLLIIIVAYFKFPVLESDGCCRATPVNLF